MDYKFNKFSKKIKPYKLISHKAWQYENKNEILKLDWNEATVQPSKYVKKQLIKFIENEPLNWYPNIYNNLLIEKLSEYCEVPVKNILYFNGSDSAHSYIIKAFANSNDSVLILAPTYDNFRFLAELHGLKIDYFYLNTQNFSLDQVKFLKVIKETKPKFVYICNPNNPTGTVLSENFIKNLLKQNFQTLFIIDEAYFEFYGKTVAKLVLEFDNLIITRTFSKAFALAGLRIGYVISSVCNIKLLATISNPKDVNALAQVAAIAALKDIEYMRNYVKEVKVAKEWLYKELKKMGFYTVMGEGNFLLMRVNKPLKYKLLSFLEKNHIFVRDLSHLKGLENYIRITVGTKPQMEQFIEKLYVFYKTFFGG